MNVRLSYTVITCILSICVCRAQDDLRSRYKSFSEASKQKYRNWEDSSCASFVNDMRKHWDAYNINSELVRAKMRPVDVADTSLVPVHDEQLDISGTKIENRPSRPTNATFRNNNADVSAIYSNTRRLDFRLFGYPVYVNVPVDYANISLRDSHEKSVATAWEELASSDNGSLMCDMLSVASRLSLNDWGRYNLAKSCASAIFPASTRLQTIASVYLANNLGLDCRVACSSDKLLPVFSSVQTVYARKYIMLNNTRYYIDGATVSSAITTYSITAKERIHPLNMDLACPPSFAESTGVFSSMWHTSVLNEDISISLDHCLLEFYNSYPQTDLCVYAGATPDGQFSDSLLSGIDARIHGLSKSSALALVLKMMHTDFDYKTDTEQFGFEKVMFCEENFNHRYNDCEDRAVLFSYIVRNALNLDVILLEYNDHVNCAVAVDGIDKGKYVNLNGRKFYVCDPTYIGADIGMSPVPATTKPNKVWVL